MFLGIEKMSWVVNYNKITFDPIVGNKSLFTMHFLFGGNIIWKLAFVILRLQPLSLHQTWGQAQQISLLDNIM